MKKGFYVLCTTTNTVVADGITNMKGAGVLVNILNYQNEFQKEKLEYSVRYAV